MKLFISHSSKNADYGNALVNLLTGIGISADQIIFTSNDAFGIPIGDNIFDWLKTQISSKPHVLYLLSPDYYKSIACLNEMGAAWIIENKHTLIFTPDFKLESHEFQNGVINPRKNGLFIDNNDKLIEFINTLSYDFEFTDNQVLMNQKIRLFLDSIKEIKQNSTAILNEISDIRATIESPQNVSKKIQQNKYEGKSKFFNDLLNEKLREEEVLLVHYIIDNAKNKLFTGWQEDQEIENIIEWENLNNLNNTLSNKYKSVLRRFEMKKLVSVSAVTSGNNPKEMKITEDFQDDLLELPTLIDQKIHELIKNNSIHESDSFDSSF